MRAGIFLVRKKSERETNADHGFVGSYFIFPRIAVSFFPFGFGRFQIAVTDVNGNVFGNIDADARADIRRQDRAVFKIVVAVQHERLSAELYVLFLAHFGDAVFKFRAGGADFRTDSQICADVFEGMRKIVFSFQLVPALSDFDGRVRNNVGSLSSGSEQTDYGNSHHQCLFHDVIYPNSFA